MALLIGFQVPGHFDPTSPPGIAYVNGRPKILFDDTTVEIMRFGPVKMPAFTGALSANIQYTMASAVADDVSFEVFVMAVTDGDALDIDTDSYDSANAGTETVPGTAGHMSEISVTLTNADSVAEGDWVVFRLEREADDAINDDATGDAEVWTFSISDAA